MIRRILRIKVTTVWTSLYRQFRSSRSAPKHIKIDDEERQLNEDQWTSIGKDRHIVYILKMLLISLLLLFILVMILGYTVYKPPTLLVGFMQWYNPDVLFFVPLPASQRVVALSFDDAPAPSTAKILDLLQEYGAKATFFIIGSQISEYPQLLRRIVAEGHEVGNHAWDDEPSVKLPLSELERQIKDIDSLLPANEDGAKYFRPGSGFFNQKMIEMVKSLGYRAVLGGIYPHDPQIHNPRLNAKHVLSMLRPGGIVIMHDRRSYSAEQIELVLRGLKEKGWRGESVGGLLRLASGTDESYIPLLERG
jgi:peptidoglycan/xylan/chitin deacetylase (PgdA/CDA1 family)